MNKIGLSIRKYIQNGLQLNKLVGDSALPHLSFIHLHKTFPGLAKPFAGFMTCNIQTHPSGFGKFEVPGTRNHGAASTNSKIELTINFVVEMCV